MAQVLPTPSSNQTNHLCSENNSNDCGATVMLDLAVELAEAGAFYIHPRRPLQLDITPQGICNYG